MEIPKGGIPGRKRNGSGQQLGKMGQTLSVASLNSDLNIGGVITTSLMKNTLENDA